MSDIKLNLVNLSQDANNSSYVIFQKNASLDTAVQDVAWIVVKNLGINDNHPFVYPMGLTVSAQDSDGNYMPQIATENDSVHSVEMTPSGHRLSQSPGKKAANPREVELWNSLSQGAIHAEIYRNGKLLARKSNVVPGSKANFKFKPSIFIGCVSQLEEGAVMDSNVTVQHLQEIPLLGIKQADIVISGGGIGSEATGYQFTLENIS
ncbi:MAG TPA: hypothetical protein DCG19_08675 [Cryomorphaceae bacterium]|nr:hypothetical protein [Owenweeksia sp.]HAD97467.1 hypothetical protein [Cryomorphaceae bacterium]HBF21788.1 hypothetical protein [Cryomorphaceae bacterium]HCQ15939.1 hypothetical protein [Cryomorphaceae bacterium]|tara:strand:+ start:201 stop:821 length:621 start_codon:yes stop_codon:yes gene_type:complete